MRRRLYSYVLIFTFCAGLVAPLLWLGDAETSEMENRVLATAPEWPRSLSAMGEFLREWESYFNDQYGLRAAGIRLEATISRALGDAPSSLVVLGKDDWLFYAGTRFDRPMEDFAGLNRFSEAELERWARALSERAERLRGRGIRYVFVIVPNKAEIYPEYLPGRYARRLAEPRARQLVAYLREHTSVDVLYLREELLRGKAATRRFGPFGKWGTHWNAYGAALGYNAIDRWLRSGELRAEEIYDHSDFELGPTGVDTDLADLALREAPAVALGPVLKVELKRGARERLDLSFLKLPERREGLRISFRNESDQTALVFGDSFFEGLADYLQRNFGELYFLPMAPSTNELKVAARAFPADVLIEQRVERFLWDVPEE